MGKLEECSFSCLSFIATAFTQRPRSWKSHIMLFDRSLHILRSVQVYFGPTFWSWFASATYVVLAVMFKIRKSEKRSKAAMHVEQGPHRRARSTSYQNGGEPGSVLRYAILSRGESQRGVNVVP